MPGGARWVGRVAAVLAVTAVAACAGTSLAPATDKPLPGSVKGSLQYSGGWASVVETHVRLDDGRTVVCLAVMSGSGKSLDCDWRGASR